MIIKISTGDITTSISQDKQKTEGEQPPMNHEMNQAPFSLI